MNGTPVTISSCQKYDDAIECVSPARFVEALLLTTLTVFIGYLIMSGFLAALGTSSLMGYILYYPFWYALIVLAVLYGVCILCGSASRYARAARI